MTSDTPTVAGRKEYLDWLRGVGVLVMIHSHVLDSWTLPADRNTTAFHWTWFIGGVGGAPLFLFLAGVVLAIGTSSRVRHGRTEPEAVALARRRGWQIFGLAFLFRLQSWLISGGAARGLLKVDILNIMGIGMLMAALLWSLGRTRAQRAFLLAAAAAAASMLTPVIRSADVIALLPNPVEWYLRPPPSGSTFPFFPWAGFLLAGAAVGLWLDMATTAGQERLANIALGAIGLALATGGYAASFLPPLYPQTNFWSSSPTFFFLRLGLVIALLPVAYFWDALPGRLQLREIGRSSLFVYWIHVELVYGVLSTPLHRRLPLATAYLACVLMTVGMFGLVKLKKRVNAGLRPQDPGLAAGQVLRPEPALSQEASA